MNLTKRIIPGKTPDTKPYNAGVILLEIRAIHRVEALDGVFRKSGDELKLNETIITSRDTTVQLNRELIILINYLNRSRSHSSLCPPELYDRCPPGQLPRC